MRSLACRLPLLIGLLSIGIVGSPASAAEQGDVGIQDRVVRVAARATIPAVDVSSAEEGCVWRMVIEDDRLAMYDGDGQGIFSDTGRWFQKFCHDEPVGVAAPEGGGFSIPEMAEQATDLLDPAKPTWAARPDGIGTPMLVQAPTWLWVDRVYWSTRFTVRVSTPSGRVWTEATATPTSTVWRPGDGNAVVCATGGAVWEPGDATGCSHTYRHSSAGTAGLALTVMVVFDVSGRSFVAPIPALVGTIDRTSDPVLVQVAEIQAIETARR